jgi:hypothetical protein
VPDLCASGRGGGGGERLLSRGVVAVNGDSLKPQSSRV